MVQHLQMKTRKFSCLIFLGEEGAVLEEEEVEDEDEDFIFSFLRVGFSL